VKGLFKRSLSEGEFSAMMAVLRYVSWQKLDSSYAVDWTDDQTITLEIRYNGRVKRIADNGEIGSFGLMRLYTFFFRWSESVKWESGGKN
jgi:hypothetical protein